MNAYSSLIYNTLENWGQGWRADILQRVHGSMNCGTSIPLEPCSANISNKLLIQETGMNFMGMMRSEKSRFKMLHTVLSTFLDVI